MVLYTGEVVGSMSAVNAQISRTGLKGDFSLRPLVSDIAMGNRHPPPAARKDQVSKSIQG